MVTVQCGRCSRVYGIQTGQSAQDAVRMHAETCDSMLMIDRLVNGKAKPSGYRDFDENHPLRV
jgi:hypothetical protein